MMTDYDQFCFYRNSNILRTRKIHVLQSDNSAGCNAKSTKRSVPRGIRLWCLYIVSGKPDQPGRYEFIQIHYLKFFSVINTTGWILLHILYNYSKIFFYGITN